VVLSAVRPTHARSRDHHPPPLTHVHSDTVIGTAHRSLDVQSPMALLLSRE
jgi:hypothetical protein